MTQNIDAKATEAKLVAFMTDPAAGAKIHYLRDRWQDEREYEDFAEYPKVAEKICTDNGYRMISLTKRFDMTIEAHGHTFLIGMRARGFFVEHQPAPTAKAA